MSGTTSLNNKSNVDMGIKGPEQELEPRKLEVISKHPATAESIEPQ